MTEAPEIADADIRAWARATGREVGIKGRVGAELRREYERVNAEANDAEPPPAAPESAPGLGEPHPPGAAAAGGPPAAPGPARDETPPAVPGSAARRFRDKVRARYATPAARRPRSRGRSRARRRTGDRISTERFTTRVWEGAGRLLQPVNLPVARCIEWQAPTAGAMLDQTVKDTFLDPVFQAAARWEGKLEAFGALFGTPAIVMLLQLPPNQPHRVELFTNAQTGDTEQRLMPYPVGAIRHQFLLGALRECLDMCAEAQDKLPAEVKQRQLEREQRRRDMDEIISMFFAPPPGPGDAAAAAAEEQAMQAAREHLRGT